MKGHVKCHCLAKEDVDGEGSLLTLIRILMGAGGMSLTRVTQRQERGEEFEVGCAFNSFEEFCCQGLQRSRVVAG